MEELICSIMLSALRQISVSTKIEMLNRLGSAEAVIAHHKDIKAVIPDANDNLVNVLKNVDLPRQWAEQELQYCNNHSIRVLPYNSADYPSRLRECTDAPVVLYFRGTANINASRIISIVGTRKCTAYGQDCVHNLVNDLQKLDPNILIVSGLAYGIDVCAHRNAIANNMQTVGVLAHGLDELYPSSHRDIASQMVNMGGLLTEYPTRTYADKVNFIARNRIVAGISDATILVESAKKGGGLITAEMAKSYSRDVFAFPGRTTDYYSEGCNRIIRDNCAAMITSADDLFAGMNWMTAEQKNKKRQTGIERQLFPELSAEEQSIVNVLTKDNNMQLNVLMSATGIPVNRLTAILFEMEMKGLIRAMAGGVYHLIA